MKWVELLIAVLFLACHPNAHSDEICEKGKCEASKKSSAAEVARIPTDGVFTIKPTHSGKCLDISGARKDDFAPAQQWTCNGTEAQTFKLVPMEGDWFAIRNTNSGKCFDAMGGSTAPGTQFIQYECSGKIGHNQHFKFENGMLKVRHGNNLCLDIDSWGTQDGAKLVQWSCHGGANQKFSMVRGSNVKPPPSGGGDGDGNTGQGNNGQYVKIKVKNQCPFPLWMHGSSAQGVLQPDNVRMNTGETREWRSPNLAISGRFEARRDANLQADAAEKVEYTFVGNPVVLNYNLTYVDFYGLPVSVTSSGKGADCKKATCDQPIKNFFEGCPSPLWDGQRCISPRTYCLNAKNQNDPYCSKLDAKINECVNNFADCAHARGAKTPEAFACSGRFSEDPKNCAAINRNMLADRESADKSKYYRQQPYNDYAKWSHEKCPNIYSFSYDDYPMNAGTSGFHACADGSELSIVWCPKG